ncbi:MAG: InlB B-repeat-containing protein, partial [Oscillospiraceae bacterium]|nr:InlB B-repeat-containing protein [Oscillospiraceae bacterium]
MQKQIGKQLKRTICLLLVFSMFLTVLPFSALGVTWEDAVAARMPAEVAESIASLDAPIAASSEEGIVGIMPLSDHRPAGIPVTVTANTDVTTEAQLRDALNTTDTRTIRIMNDINITGGVMPVRGTKYVYSNRETPFAVTRTSGTARHMEITGSHILHLYNVAFTRPQGDPRPGGSITSDNRPQSLGLITPGGPATNGGGIRLNSAGARLHLHAGAEISHNRTSGRGGGIEISNGYVFVNEGAVVSHNHSGNTAAGGGGGIFAMQAGGRLNVNGGVIAYNHAAAAGGGISLTYNQTGTAATLTAHNMTLRGNTAGTLGGGLHANTNSTVTMTGVNIIEYNTATYGGGMRFFSGSATTITLAAGSIVRNNAARNHGGGISIRDQNNVQLHATGTLFEGNVAIGQGGAFRHEGPALVDGAVRFTDSTFRNNRASDGGAISLVTTGTTNLPVTSIVNRLRVINTTFEGNTATNGLLVDENLAVRNADNAFFAGGQVGSATWIGPRINAAGVVQAIEPRNHIWNNYDVVTRNRMAAREVTFDVIGTASVSSLMEAELTQTRRSTNHTTTTVGMATTEAVAVSPVRPLEDGETVIRESLTNFRVTYLPWNADVIYWLNNQITRDWVGDPVTGSLVETIQTTTIPGSAGTLEQTGVMVNQHTWIQPRIDYRTHDIIFTADPSTPTTGGTVDGVASVTRNLRESRSAAAHTGESPRGEPIGAPPDTEARANWVFVGWSGPIVDSNGDALDTTGMTIPERIAAQEAAIAAMYVTGAMTFVANFELRTAHSITLSPGNETRGNSGYVVYTATVVDQFGDPMANQNGFVINWTTSASQYVTINNTTNPVGQPNTTTATVTVAAPAGSSSTITATLGSDTSISASAVVTVSLAQIATSISVTPADNYVFRNRSVGLTAVVLDQFGNPMADQNSFVINWASATPANVTINPTSNAAGQANTTTATATATAVMASNNNVTATLDGTSISGTAVVTIGTTYGLQVSYRARNTPVGMTVTVEGDVIAANTGASVATHQVIPSDAVELFSGSTPNQTFLGWRTHAEYQALPTNSDGNRFIPGFTPPAATISSFTMPAENRHMVALWGNQDGEVSLPNHVDVTFNANHGATPATATRRITLYETYAAAMAHADVVALESRTGFVFGGWFTSAALANGTTQDGRVLPATIVTNANNHTLFARWVARTDIQVTFNANHGATPATATHNV